MRGSRSVVLAPRRVGEIVLALPAFEAIVEDRPTGVDVVVPAVAERLVKAARLFRLVLPRGAGFFDDRRLLSVAEYDEAFVLEPGFAAALLPFWARITVRRGYRGAGRSLFFSEPADRPPVDRHLLFDLDPLLESAGIARTSERPRVPISAGFAQAAAAKLAEAGVDPGRPFVGLHLGDDGDPARGWPNESFGALASGLRGAGIAVALFATPPTAEAAARLASAASPALPLVPPAEDWLEQAALFAGSRLLVTAESGEMHLAAAAGVRVVALFGPGDPARNGPIGDGHRVLRRGSMAEIAADDVAAVVRTAWSEATA